MNTDAVGYTVVSFGLLNPPTDAIGPPTLAQLFPFAEPAVPFNIAGGGQFTGILVDIAVPLAAQIKDHNFAIEAATNINGPNVQTITSNFAAADLTVAPEPTTGILVCIGLAGFCFASGRRQINR